MSILKKQPYSFLIIISLFLSSCATVLSPEKGPYILDSNPGTAQVFDESDNLLGTTPYDLKKTGSRVKVLTLKKEGYVNKNVSIYRKSKNGLLFLDAMLLCIPCIIDLSSENTTTIEPKNTTVILKKSPKVYDVPIMLAVDKVTYEKPELIKGRLNGMTKKPGDKGSSRSIGDIDYIENTILEKLDKTFIDAVTVASNNNSKSGMSKAKLRVKPTINNLDFTLKGKYPKFYEGTESMKCTWTFYRASDTKDKLGSIVTEVSLNRIKGSQLSVLDEVMAEAISDLLSNDTLYDFLSRNEKTYLSETKGSVIQLINPPKTTFESTKEMLKACKEGVVTVITKDVFGS